MKPLASFAAERLYGKPPTSLLSDARRLERGSQEQRRLAALAGPGA
jgi:hypothetical protein